MKKSELNKNEKKQRILQAAQEIFQSSGFMGANMDKIAEKAQVTKQTIYRYFETKENLFKESLEAQRETTRNEFIEALGEEDTDTALRLFAFKFVSTHLSKRHLANIRLLVAEGPEVPEITKAFYTTGAEKTRTELLAFLRKAFPGKDVDFAATTFLSTLLSQRMAVLTGLTPEPSEDEIKDHADKTVDMLLQLLGSQRQVFYD
jgi:AcrR family transcriptional regulator